MDNVQLNATPKKYLTPYTTLATNKTETFGTSIKNLKIIFTPAISDANARIELLLKQHSGTTYLDNITLLKLPQQVNL